MPILLAFSAAALLLPRAREIFVLLLLAWGMGLAGLADDIARLSPKVKLLAQILMAGLAVSLGIVHPLTSHLLFNRIFSVIWIVGITNAVNLLDNMDGLAAGVALIALIQIVLLAGPGAPVAGLALCLAATIAGFLFFNMNPAKVFMGDVGSLSIGFFLACASVKTAEHLSSLGSVFFVPCLVLFIPVFDTLLVSVTRRMNGRAISQGARDHTSHRLVLIGLNERKAVALLYAIAMVAGVMAFLWKSSWADLGAGLVALFLIASTLFWLYLAKVQLPQSWLSRSNVVVLAIPEFLRQFAAKTSVLALDLSLILLGLYLAYVGRFETLDHALMGRFLFAAALSIAIKLPFLMAFGAYKKRWNLSRRRDVYPILKGVGLAALVLAGISGVLPPSKAPGSSIILLDAFLTSCLLVLCRASTGIFDDLLNKPAALAMQKRSAPKILHANGFSPELVSHMETTNGAEIAARRRMESARL